MRLIMVIILQLLFYSFKSANTDIQTKKYVIFTFQVFQKKQKDYYYWITPQDSIAKRKDFSVFPLYPDEYSKDLLNQCQMGKTIDIFSASTATDFNFDSAYKLRVKNLFLLIRNHKIKVQTFTKKWSLKKEKVVVYATPIVGKFCNCMEIHGNAPDIFRGLVYLPFGPFHYENDFWKNKIANVVKYVDYSYVEYSSHYPSYMHGNSNIRVKNIFENYTQ